MIGNDLKHSTFRPATARRSRPWVAAILTAAIVAAIGTALFLVQRPDDAVQGKLVVAVNLDADVAGNGVDLARGHIEDVAASLAKEGGGSMIVVAASGGTAQVVATEDLRVERDGQFETDAAVRQRVVSERVGNAITALKATPSTLTAEGRNLISLFQMLDNLKPPRGQLYDITYVGFGLGTVDPGDARLQLLGDPGQAVAALDKRLPKLPGATFHLVFPAAAGPQGALNSVTSQWRKVYWEGLIHSMQATLADVDERNVPAPPITDAAVAPVIDNLADPTVRPDPLPASVGISGVPPSVMIAGTQFQPDLPDFVKDTLARDELEPIVQAWEENPGKFLRADCTGRTLPIGPRDSAIELARQRAERARDLLARFGIPVKAVGVGFDQPIPGIPAFDQRQRSVVCQLVPQP